MAHSILLADDSVTIQKVVAVMFESPEYRLVSVSNGDDALEKVRQEAPDLVIADIHMPGASGYQVASGVKAISADIPVLLLVGTFEAFSEEEADASGADGFLMKPFESSELRSRVGELLSTGVSPVTEAQEVIEVDAVDVALEPDDFRPPSEDSSPSADADVRPQAEPGGLSSADIESIAARAAEMLAVELPRLVDEALARQLADSVNDAE